MNSTEEESMGKKIYENWFGFKLIVWRRRSRKSMSNQAMLSQDIGTSRNESDEDVILKD